MFTETWLDIEDPEYSRNLQTLLDLVSKNLPNLSLEDQYKMFCDAADWCGSELAWRRGDRSK